MDLSFYTFYDIIKTMEHRFETYFESQRDRNLEALAGHTDEPTIIMNIEDEVHTFVQFGILESYTDDHMILRGDYYHKQPAVVLEIPDEDIIIAGHEEVFEYANLLTADFRLSANIRMGAIAATILNRFATPEQQDSVEQLCQEVSRAIVTGATDGGDFVAAVLDAPAALKGPVLHELRMRLARYDTLHEISHDDLIMTFAVHIASFEGISELEALQRLSSSKA